MLMFGWLEALKQIPAFKNALVWTWTELNWTYPTSLAIEEFRESEVDDGSTSSVLGNFVLTLFSHQMVWEVSPVEETLPPVIVSVWKDEARQTLQTTASVVLSAAENKRNNSNLSPIPPGVPPGPQPTVSVEMRGCPADPQDSWAPGRKPVLASPCWWCEARWGSRG